MRRKGVEFYSVGRVVFDKGFRDHRFQDCGRDCREGIGRQQTAKVFRCDLHRQLE